MKIWVDSPVLIRYTRLTGQQQMCRKNDQAFIGTERPSLEYHTVLRLMMSRGSHGLIKTIWE